MEEAEAVALTNYTPSALLSLCLIGKAGKVMKHLELYPTDPAETVPEQPLTMSMLLATEGSEKRGFSALQVATSAEKNAADVIDVLVWAGFPLDHKDKLGMTAFHTAADKESPDAMIKLLSLDGCASHLETADLDGNTPLHYAAWGGRTEIVTALLRAGASKDAVNGANKTPAQEAEGNGKAAVATLITEGPPPEAEPEAPAE